MDIGFTGTRDELTGPQMDTLHKALTYYRRFASVMHNGDCVGADAYAGLYWQALEGKLWIHPPQFNNKRAYLKAAITSEPKPYLRRNMKIVLASDVVLACPKEETEELRSGTWATARYAKDAGKELYIVTPSGQVKKF